MRLHERILQQSESLKLALFAVTLTALPRANTPVLLALHWHGFRPDPSARHPPATRTPQAPVPGSVFQLNPDWRSFERLDEAMLEAAWRLGAWELDREERRGCNTAGAPAREALECRQAFGDDPFRAGPARDLVCDAPDRVDLMQTAARIGYVKWAFRPVRGGVWRATAEDDSLSPDGSRALPCPVKSRSPVGTKVSRLRRRLGHLDRIIVT